jgi:hypothetical protein
MSIVEQLHAHWADILIAVGAVGVAAESVLAALRALVVTCRSLAGFLAMLALYTATATDDRAIAAVIRGLDKAADWLDRASAFVPRLRAGRGRLAMDPRGTANLLVLLVVAPLLTGCAGRALVAADGARAAACIQVEAQCVDRAEAGQITIEEAEACVSCARSTCDAIRERLAR